MYQCKCIFLSPSDSPLLDSSSLCPLPSVPSSSRLTLLAVFALLSFSIYSLSSSDSPLLPLSFTLMFTSFFPSDSRFPAFSVSVLPCTHSPTFLKKTNVSKTSIISRNPPTFLKKNPKFLKTSSISKNPPFLKTHNVSNPQRF